MVLANNERILRIDYGDKLTGKSRSMIYKLQSFNGFPSSVQLSERAVGWRHGDVVEWLESRRRGHAVPKASRRYTWQAGWGSLVDNENQAESFPVGAYSA